MGKRKNSIKSEFDTCICCGKHLENPDDKRIQRINLKKGVSRNNVVIICKECQRKLGNNQEDKIFLHKFDDLTMERYFINHDKAYKKIILKSMGLQKRRYYNLKVLDKS